MIVTMESGVRARKSAKIKLDILIASTQLLGKKSFRELYVDDICEKSGVSKVTFFKYFPQKDDVLLYYLRIWCLDRAIEFYHNPREGLNGIFHLIEKLSESYDKNPGLILSLISYLTSLQRPPSPFPLKSIEREMLYPNDEAVKKIELMSIDQMVEKFLLEAIFQKQIIGVSDTKDISGLFLSVIYGTIITAHLRQVKPIKVLFKRNIESLLKKLGPQQY